MMCLLTQINMPHIRFLFVSTQRSQGQKAKPVYLKELLEFGAWNLFLRLGLTRSARLILSSVYWQPTIMSVRQYPALPRSKSKTSQPAVAIFVFTKCKSKLRISHKTKTRLWGRVLLSLVTWLGLEPQL